MLETMKVHLIGVGGIGVSALARYFLSLGAKVSGSDEQESELTSELISEGVTFNLKPKSKVITKDLDLVIHSAAIEPTNLELVAARTMGLRCSSYAEAVGELTKSFFTIAVSGSHGKSTTTAMIALILVAAGMDPTVIVGTKLAEFGGKNFRAGKSKYLVLEADEYNRSFHNYRPQVAVVTNIDREHLDTYKTLRGVVGGFASYLNLLPKNGVFIGNYADRNVRTAALGVLARKFWFNREKFKKRKLLISGWHNQLNAEAAATAARELGVSDVVIEKSLRNFCGTWRRMEELQVTATGFKAKIFSDYAHHPTEIMATLQALREKYPERFLVCVFQPHQQDRLNRIFDLFLTAFNVADVVIILPVYVVAGREKKAKKTSLDLTRAMRQKNVFYATDFRIATHLATPYFFKKSVIVFMGAGDIDAQARELLTPAQKS